jgi:putative N-acetylmannosamine-6-phosphate epimerase
MNDPVKLQQAENSLVNAVNNVVVQVVAAGETPSPADIKNIATAGSQAVFALLMAAREIWRQ